MRPQQHDGKGDARDRDRHAGTTEHRTGAICERLAEGTRQVGPETEGAEHPDDDQTDGGGVGAVAGQLSRGGGAALGERSPAPAMPRRDLAVDRLGGRFRAGFLALERERPLPRVLVAGMPAR